MTLDEFLLQVRLRRLVLISERDVWPSPRVTGDIVQALRRHRKHLLTLIRDGDIRVCPSWDRHRPYWRYAGQGRYVCEVCERIKVA